MSKGVNIPLTISGLREARENLEKLNDEFEKVKNDPIQSKKIAKEFNELSNAIDKTTDELLAMNNAGKLVGTRFDDLNEVLFQTQEEVLPLSSQIGEMEDRMYQLAAAGDTSSKEFKALQAETARLRGVIIETDREIDLMAGNTSLSTLTDGFNQLAGSVLTLNFKQAGKDLKALGGAFKGFGAILKANPIFLIVAVIAAVVTAVVTLKDKVKFLGAIFDAVGEAIGWVVQQLKDFLDWIGLTEFAEQDQAQKRKERAEENLKNIEKNSAKEQSAFDRKIALLNAEGKSTVELEIAKQKAIIETAKARAKEIIEIIKAEKITGELTKERLEELGKLGFEQVEAIKDAGNQIKIIELNAAKESKERAKERKEEKDKELAEDKARIDALNEYRKQAELEWLAEEEELSELIFQAGLTQQEKELIALDEYYFEKLEKARQHGLDVTALEEEYAKKTAEVNKKYADEKSAIDAEIFKKVEEKRLKDLEDAKAVEAAKVELVSQGLRLATELTALFADKSEKAARAAFVVQKVAAIAQATIDGYKAVLSTYANTPGGPVIKGIAAGIAGSFAALQIANISKTKFEGGSSSVSGSVPSGSFGGGGATSSSSSTPSFELFGQANEGNNVSAPQSQETTQMTVKAVVVESDITSTQNKINKIQKSAEL